MNDHQLEALAAAEALAKDPVRRKDFARECIRASLPASRLLPPPWYWVSADETKKRGWLHIAGRIGGDTDEIERKLASVRRGHVSVFLNCSGGDCTGAMRLFKAISRVRHSSCRIKTAYSAACILAQACRHRTVFEGGRLMLHEVSGGAIGGPAELRRKARELVRCTAGIEALLVSRTGKPRREVRAWLKADTYFSAADAITAGLADAIEPEPEPFVLPAECEAPPEDDLPWLRSLLGGIRPRFAKPEAAKSFLCQWADS